MQIDIRHLFLAGFLAMCAGCGAFDKQYDLARNTPKDLSRPLMGAYMGVWHSRAPRFGLLPIMGSAAKVVIDEDPDGSGLEIWLALSDYNGAKYFSPAKLKMKEAGTNSPFTAKIGAGPALVLILTGELEGDELTMQYKFVDVADEEVQHDQGTISTHRVGPAK